MKVLIVDDHPIVVSGFKALLEQDGAIAVMEAATADAAEQLVASDPPDVAVLDINLPGISGFELARRLLERDPAAKIIMFSMNDDPVFLAQAQETGARGYVSKNDNPANMIKAIRAVANGGTSWPPGMADKVAHLGRRGASGSSARLTARELEILRLLAKGKSLSEIADLVGVSYKTVATTCASLRTRLAARTQVELVRIAVEQRLV